MCWGCTVKISGRTNGAFMRNRGSEKCCFLLVKAGIIISKIFLDILLLKWMHLGYTNVFSQDRMFFWFKK